MNRTSPIFERQGIHALLLAALLALVIAATMRWEGMLAGAFLGISARVWFGVVIAVPIVHQVYVLICWRLQLHYSSITRRLGDERGFTVYQKGFAALFLSRPVTMVALGAATMDTLAIPTPVRIGVAVALAVPAVYTIYCAERYFGSARIVGIDHFDPSYRDVPLIQVGIFKYVDNAMYAVGFLLFWAIAVAFASRAALLAAAYGHVYIWIHYVCTEVPDMKVIYGDKSS